MRDRQGGMAAGSWVGVRGAVLWNQPALASEKQHFSEKVTTEARTDSKTRTEHTGHGGGQDSAPCTRHRVGEQLVGGPVAHGQVPLFTEGGQEVAVPCGQWL